MLSLQAAVMGAIAADVRRGALIVLEGLDRSGKSSQCSRLTSFLHTQGLSVEAWRFPDRSTPMGKMISSYLSSQMDLDDASIHLLFSANRWEKRALMEAKLRAGTTLVVDRYSYSGVAFSAAKGLDLDWCKAAAERGGYGGERYEKVEFQKKVEQNFKSLQDSTWQNIDATQSIDTLESLIREAALKVVNDCHSGRELSHMWPVEKSRESPH
ncbi:hypothetical protein BDL97_01G150200 [Sphagnum fallax]|nr:hypothetical protein BDL97_01G150200 [Sphagnum fallax]KAH8975321.1 hypothetical protein BDL97_01G150200 [Sphagnum fallax]